MKLLFACHGIGNGGAERVLSTLANSFCNKGYEVSLITTNPPYNDYYVDDCIGRFICSPTNSSPLLRIVNRIREIRKVIKVVNPDCIISFSANVNVQLLLAGLFLKKRIIVSERTDPSKYPTTRFGRVLRTLSYFLANAIVFQTNEARDYFPSYVRKKSIIIINPICINLSMTRPLKIENRVIGIGSLGEQKNWGHAILSFKLFIQTHPQYRLEIYGEGPLRNELQTMIDMDEDLRKSVYLKGFSRDVSKLLVSSKMYVSSSIYEGISNSMLESLALGVPTICTDCPVGGAKSFINDGVNGILVPINDVTTLCNAMSKIADDEVFANSISKEGRKIEKSITPDVIMPKWEKLIQRVLEE